jgi:iron complex transport system substrate-binding protein
LQHPALAALPASTRRISTDGRAWTCLGPALASEIARLRRVVGP